MRLLSRLLLLVSVASFGFLTSCETTTRPAATGGTYRVTAKRPHNPANVKVKVSLSKQNIYVMEGERVLMAVATTVGTTEKPTPKGNFTIYRKEENKRSNTYGFRVQGDRVIPAKSSDNIPGRYVGYPMGYWVEFKSAYGFHQGYVHTRPRSHGCLRLKGEAAPKFFALVRSGTKVNIADSQPEDATIGPKIVRPDDSKLPDIPSNVVITSAAFQKPTGPLLED
jgi:lipoprotein-anchoring transpeptidase ErfK/SrfK